MINKYRLMMNSKYIVSVFCVLISVQLISCKKPVGYLHNFFSKPEVKTVEQIIDYFDSFVLTKAGSQMHIDKAYHAYFDAIRDSVEYAGELNNYLPAIEERIGFYKTLDQKVLAEIYSIKDTLKIHYKGEAEARILYRPYSFELNLHGKFFALLKELGNRNEFFSDFYNSVEVCGDFCPSLYPQIFYNHNQINFNVPEERLAVIVAMLRIGAPIH